LAVAMGNAAKKNENGTRDIEQKTGMDFHGFGSVKKMLKTV
jgi:hypothetical protein